MWGRLLAYVERMDSQVQREMWVFLAPLFWGPQGLLETKALKDPKVLVVSLGTEPFVSRG